MKLIFSDKTIESELRSFLSEKGLKIGIEFKEGVEETFNRFIQSQDKPLPMGAMSPEGFIDVGKYFISLILSDDLAKGVLAAATYDLIKNIISHFKIKAKEKNKEMSIITDEFNSFNCIDTHSKSIYFVIPCNLKDKDMECIMSEITIIRNKLIDLFKLVDFCGFTVFRLTYSEMNKWLINIS